MPKVTSIELEPVEWDYGGTVWRLMHDRPESVKWLMSSDGRIEPPGPDDVPSALVDIVDPAQAEELAATFEDLSLWPPADQWKAVAGWHAYMSGRHDLVNANMLAAARMRDVADRLGAKLAEQIADETTGPQDEQLPLEGA